MTMNQDMMIVDGVRQEILLHFGCRLDPHLRTAEVGFELTSLEFDIDSQQSLQVTAQLHERVIACRQVTVDSHAYTRLEMGRELEFLGHLQRQGTVRKEYLSVRLDACRVDLETVFSGQFLANHHG